MTNYSFENNSIDDELEQYLSIKSIDYIFNEKFVMIFNNNESSLDDIIFIDSDLYLY